MTTRYRCCSVPMLDLTEAGDSARGVRVWLCAECGQETEVACEAQAATVFAPPPQPAPDEPPVYPLPLEPTRAQPGTAAKVRVMMERARLRLQLFHPGDAKLEGV